MPRFINRHLHVNVVRWDAHAKSANASATLKTLLDDAATVWQQVRMERWYVKPLPTFVDAKSVGALSILEVPTFSDIY